MGTNYTQIYKEIMGPICIIIRQMCTMLNTTKYGTINSQRQLWTSSLLLELHSDLLGNNRPHMNKFLASVTKSSKPLGVIKSQKQLWELSIFFVCKNTGFYESLICAAKI